MAFVDFIKEPEWVHDNLHTVKLVDATWFMPGATDDLPKGCLEGSSFFDLDKVAAPHPSLKHMLPSVERFEDFNKSAGINENDHVICYDRHGVRTAPRAWWTYRMFGHEKVSVLNGGLPAWLAKGFSVMPQHRSAKNKSSYKSRPALSGVIGFEALNALLSSNPQIIDARSEGRFHGTEPEPRPGLKSGHMPGAFSLPYTSLLNGNMIADLGKIAETIGKSGIDLEAPIITTCGSGITAAVLTLVFYQLGAQNIRLYDASWAEWGASNAPIEI